MKKMKEMSEAEELEKWLDIFYRAYFYAPTPYDISPRNNKMNEVEARERIRVLILTRTINDTAFIKHIQDHLKAGDRVMCKICGKTVHEICEAGNG